MLIRGVQFIVSPTCSTPNANDILSGTMLACLVLVVHGSSFVNANPVLSYCPTHTCRLFYLDTCRLCQQPMNDEEDEEEGFCTLLLQLLSYGIMLAVEQQTCCGIAPTC